MNQHPQPQFWLASLPESEVEAIEWLLPLLDKDSRALRKVAADDFKRTWYFLAFLYAGLHPGPSLGSRENNLIRD